MENTGKENGVRLALQNPVRQVAGISCAAAGDHRNSELPPPLRGRGRGGGSDAYG
jgi:hypothetical protein